MNNDLVPGFDDVLDENLRIKLEIPAEAKEYLIVHLNGHIHHANHEFASDRIRKLIDAGFVRLIIDCSNFEAQSDTTTGVFVATFKNTHNRNGDLILIGVNPIFSSLLEFTGMKKYFNCKKDLAEALEGIKRTKE